MFWQIYSFVEWFLSKYQRRFKEGYNAQYSISAMLEKWKSGVDKVVSFDLSKAFES